MKKLLLILMAAIVLTGCKYASPGAGEEIVLVRKPYIWGHGGVDPNPVRTGAQIIAISTEELAVVMQPRTFIQHFNDMFTNDGVPLEFNTATKLTVTDSVLMATKFGVWEYDSGGGIKWPGWFGNNLMKPIENFVRQAVRKHGLNETALNPVAIDMIDNEVKIAIQAEIDRIKLPVTLSGFTVGRAAPPDAVKTQRIETAAQQQRRLTEEQGKLAEDARKAREESRAAADNAYRNQMGLSPQQFVELERIKAWHEACKSSGKCIVGNIGGVVVQ